MANVTLRLVKGTPLTNQEVDNNFSNLNIFKTEIGGDLGGNVLYPTVIGIRGRSVTSDAPANTQVLVWSDTANAWTPGNAASSYADLQTKPAVNVLVTGDITGSSNVVLQNTNTNLITLNTSFNPTNFDSRYLKLSNPTTQIVTSYINFQGNVTFSGNVTTISANNLIIEDNFIYLNNASQNTNVDFGFVGNYNDGIFAHAGFFRDASDNGTWKIFDGYLPEPSEELNIDTDNASFRLANLKVQVLIANTITGISNTTVVTNLNADLLDGQQGTYYVDYTNATNRPAANVALTGDVTGSANLVLVSGTNQITIATTIQPNSVALGTDTTGNYTDRVLPGNGISAAGTADEGNVITIALTNTSVVASTYGNNRIIPVITVDAQGRITAASNVTLTPGVGTSSDTQILYNSSGAVVGSSSLTFDGTNLRSPYLIATNSSGDEGGEILLAKPASNVTYSGTGITIDAYQNKLRIFEQGGSARGVYIDLTAANAGVGTNLLSSGGGGTSNYPDLTNKPAVNVTFTGDVTGAGNVLLTNGGTNSLSIALTVQPNSVALGTDTTGNYTDRVIAGNGIIASGTSDEGNVITVGLTNTGVTATTYGNATIVPVITVDAQGRITSASNVNISGLGGGASLDAQKNFTVVDACALTATGCHNVFIGSGAGRCTTFGKFNFFAGQCAGFESTTSCNNIFLGKFAGQCTTTSSNNVFLGNYAGRRATCANNTYIGAFAGQCDTFGQCNVFLGFCSGALNSSGNDNTFLGFIAGCSNTSGSYNTFLGLRAGFANTTGSFNTFLGHTAGRNNTTGCYNTFIGYYSGYNNTFGFYNNFLGVNTGYCNTTGQYNLFLGNTAGRTNSTGSKNVFLGHAAGFCNTTGCQNTFLGHNAGLTATTGCNNAIIGHLAGRNIKFGSFNALFGHSAGCSITTGCNNIIIGSVAGTAGLSDTIILATGTCERIRTDGALGNTTVTGNVIATAFFGDGSKLTGLSSTYTSLPDKPSINVIFSGHVSGNANVTLVSGTNLVQITTVKEAVDFYFTNTAPVSPAIGDTWVHSETGVTYRYINDGNSTQWVDLTSYSSITGGGSTASDSLSPFLLMGA